MLARLGAETREVRLPADLAGLDGLIIPGGESTTIGRLAREYGLEAAIRQRSDLALWGTCAGAIWLSKEIQGRPQQERLGLLDAEVLRNAYGRQLDSFETALEVQGLAEKFPAVFIRAPGFASVGEGVEVLARHAGRPVLVRQGRLLASTFHPELTRDERLHALFLRLASSRDLNDKDGVKNGASASPR